MGEGGGGELSCDREHGWRSGESTRLPPMWPGLISGLGVICGLVLRFFSLHKNQHFQIPIRPGNSGWKSYPVESPKNSQFPQSGEVGSLRKYYLQTRTLIERGIFAVIAKYIIQSAVPHHIRCVPMKILQQLS